MHSASEAAASYHGSEPVRQQLLEQQSIVAVLGSETERDCEALTEKPESSIVPSKRELRPRKLASAWTLKPVVWSIETVRSAVITPPMSREAL
eukprot:4392774-Prymnesium_polylepis.1